MIYKILDDPVNYYNALFQEFTNSSRVRTSHHTPLRKFSFWSITKNNVPFKADTGHRPRALQRPPSQHGPLLPKHLLQQPVPRKANLPTIHNLPRRPNNNHHRRQLWHRLRMRPPAVVAAPLHLHPRRALPNYKGCRRSEQTPQ